MSVHEDMKQYERWQARFASEGAAHAGISAVIGLTATKPRA